MKGVEGCLALSLAWSIRPIVIRQNDSPVANACQLHPCGGRREAHPLRRRLTQRLHLVALVSSQGLAVKDAGKQPESSRPFVRENHWLGLDRVGGPHASVLSAAAGKAADGPDLHVMIAENLATEPHAR